MTAPHDSLSALGAGFSNEALGSQDVFRAVLNALSHPGRPQTVAHDAQLPATGHGAAAAALLALLDSECTLWLSPTLAASQAGTWLRFHTGCQLVATPEQARFVWVALGDAMPALARLQRGSDEYPDQSATCVLDVALPGSAADNAWHLTGPGIRDVQALRVAGLPADFAQQWADNHAAFPRGVDLLLASATQLVGLPRTTRIAATAEA